MNAAPGSASVAMVALVALVGLPIVSYPDIVMARPIEPTPVLEGEDAERLLRDLERTCTLEEAKRRVQKARDLLAKVMVPAADDTAAAE